MNTHKYQVVDYDPLLVPGSGYCEPIIYQEEWVHKQEDRQTDRQLVQTLETEYIQSYTVLVVVVQLFT